MPTERTIPVTADEAVSAVHHEASGTDWIVFCHGFLSDKTGSYEYRCRRAVEEGFDAVRFDFRGCGESDGAFVDQALGSRIADLRAVVDAYDPPSVVAFGSSFGGKVAFHAAVRDTRIEAVATRAPVTDNRTFDDLRSTVAEEGTHTAETGQSIDGRFFEDLDRYPFAEVAEALDCPVAIFHGGADASVSPGDSFDAAAALDTDVLVHKFHGEGHRFSRAAEDRLQDRLFDWLSDVR